MTGTQAGDVLSGLTSVLAIIEIVFVATLMISLIFGIVLVIWAVAKWSERSATRDLIKQLRETRETGGKIFTIDEETLQNLIGRSSQPQNEQTSLVSPIRNNTPHQLQESLNQSSPVRNSDYTVAHTATTETQVLFQAGHVNLRYGDFDAAIKEFTNAIKISPGFSEAYNARGMAYRKLADLNKSLQDYTTALNLNPKLAAAYNNRGIVYMEMKQFELALSDFNNAINLEPRNAYGYCNRAIVHNNTRDFDRSLSDSSQAIEIDPNLAEAYITRGVSKLYLRSDTAAREDFNIAESLGYEKTEISNKLNTILKNR